jgi:hypothetical protein
MQLTGTGRPAKSVSRLIYSIIERRDKMNKVTRIASCIAALLALFVLSAASWAQSTDRSELTQFLNETASQGPPPPIGTRITMANWQQYKQFMPFGMVKLFEGQYQEQLG